MPLQMQGVQRHLVLGAQQWVQDQIKEGYNKEEAIDRMKVNEMHTASLKKCGNPLCNAARE